MGYLLDSNVFIQAKNQYYGFDICPGFWDWLGTAQAEGKVLSIDKVRDELVDREDELTEWVRGPGSSVFVPTDSKALTCMPRLSQWVLSRSYNQAAVNEFLSIADCFLVAYAKAHQHIIVTHERPEPHSVRKVKIPDACNALGVTFTSPYAMLRSEGACFALKET